MINEFPLPDLGEGLTEGEILKWFVAEGDVVTLNQPIVEVETAKAAVEIPSKWAGRIARIHHPAGSVVEVGTPIVSIDTGTEPTAAPSAPSTAPSTSPAPEPVGTGRTAVLVGYGPSVGATTRRPRKTVAEPVAEPVAVAPVPEPVVAPAAVRSGPVLAKPPVRKLARDLGVDLSGVTGTGPSGSITREDVHAAVGRPTYAPGRSAVRGREERIPVKGVRKLTAENMVASAFTAPHVTIFHTIDMTRSLRTLDRLRERPDWAGVRATPLLFVAKALLTAVEKYPMINSTWSGETGEIVVKHYVNLGIAAATPRGLVVPNIKDADRLSLRQLADAMTGLVATAKEGRTSPADMAGGTISITNVGVFGVDTGTPILPPGESAILVFGAVREQPWVHKGKVVPRHVTTLGLSFDHRIIDGELGSRVVREIGDWLTDPAAAVLSVM